jgi:hypothetical protein
MAFIEGEFFYNLRKKYRLIVIFLFLDVTNLRWVLAGYGKQIDRLSNYLDRFYWLEVMMTFIEEKLFHDKRRNLTVYERHASYFIARSADRI